MATTKKKILIRMDKGRHGGSERSMVGQGWFAELINYIPEPDGSLRVRRGWEKVSATGAPTTRQGWGIGHFARQRRPYIRQEATGTTAAGADPRDVVAAWPAATLADSTLVARIYLTNSSAGRAASAYTITPPAGWVSSVTPDASARQVQAWIYHKPDADAESGSVTFNVAVAAGVDTIALALEICEVRNVALASSVDTTDADDNSTSTTPDVGPTGTPTVPVGIAIAAFADEDSTDNTYLSPTNGFTATTEFFVENGIRDLNARGSYLIYDDGLAKTTGFTVTGTPQGSCAVMALFKGGGFASTDGFYLEAVKTGATELKIYRIDRENLSAGTWELLETLAVDPDVVPVSFASGLSALAYTHPSFPTLRRWRGVEFTPEALAGSPPGRFVAFHNQRGWTGGTLGKPWELYYSDVNDLASWDLVNQMLNIGQDDGEAIEDGTPFGGGLVIAKQTSLWWLNGNDKSDFDLQRLGDAGAAPGRTVMATPIGVIVAGRKHVWLWDGSTPSIISKPIEDSYGLTGDWMTVSRQDDTVFILDSGSGTWWCLDIRSGSWHVEHFGSGNDAASCAYNHDFRHLAAPKNAGAAWGTIMAFREFPGSDRVKDFNASEGANSLAQDFEAAFPDLALQSPGFSLSPTYLHMRIKHRGGNPEDTAGMFTVRYDGILDEDFSYSLRPQPDPGIYSELIPLPGGVGGVNTFGVDLNHTVPSGEESLFDVEEVLLECDVEERVFS